LEFRIFNENIGLAPSQTLPDSGKTQTPSPGRYTTVESLPSTESAISDLQVTTSRPITVQDYVTSRSDYASKVDNPLQSERETKALQTLNEAIKGLVDLGLEPTIIQNQFRQAISTLISSIENSRISSKVNLQEGAELDQRVRETRLQILTESTRVITGHSNLKREGVLDLLK